MNHNIRVLELTDNAKNLADEYMDTGAIPKSEDAYHIAIAVLNDLDALASWNFKHVVSINPIRKVHEINRKHKYTAIEIGSLDIFGDAKYGSI